MGRLGAAAARDRACSGDSMNAMRRMAALLAALALVAQVGVVEAMQDAPAKPRPQPMTPSEEARLSARASHHPQLENFTGRRGGVGLPAGVRRGRPSRRSSEI